MRAAIRSGRLRLTDDPVSKDCPPYLAALPPRSGGRPRVGRQYPCLQLTDADDPGAQQALLELVEDWSGVTVAPVRQTIAGCKALVLADDVIEGQGEAFILGREFAHVRAEGSVHTALAPEWAVEVLRNGWGELHPLALYGLIQPQSLVFYAPRDEAELAVLERILIGAYSYAYGRRVELP
jgi:hypothetical protein